MSAERIADVEPIVGRYIHLQLGGRDHRVYFEESIAIGEPGIPLVCLHTAGADGRQFRYLMTDQDVTCNFQVIAFDLPWHGKSSPPKGYQDEEYRLTTDDYVEAELQVALLPKRKEAQDRMTWLTSEWVKQNPETPRGRGSWWYSQMKRETYERIQAGRHADVVVLEVEEQGLDLDVGLTFPDDLHQPADCHHLLGVTPRGLDRHRQSVRVGVDSCFATGQRLAGETTNPGRR